MKTHPPIFHRLTMRLDAHHPVNALARRLAHQEKSTSLDVAIRRALDYQRLPRFDNYRSQGRDER